MRHGTSATGGRVYKNWNEISKLSDDRFKLAVAFATDEAVLEGLRLGFPDLFTDEEGHVGKWPLSLLRQAAEIGFASTEGLDFSCMDEIFERQGVDIPGVIIVAPATAMLEETRGAIVATPEEAEQFCSDHDDRIKLDDRFPVGLDKTTFGGVEYYWSCNCPLNHDLGHLTDAEEIYIYAWPCDLVDENT